MNNQSCRGHKYYQSRYSSVSGASNSESLSSRSYSSIASSAS